MRFAEIRSSTKLNRKRFADSIGVNQSVAGDIELGKREPSRDVLLKLAKTHRVNINWLLTGEGAMFLQLDLPSSTEGVTSISGTNNIGIVKNLGEVQHFTMSLPAEHTQADRQVEQHAGFSIYEIPLLTKEQVLHFDPAKEIPEPKSHSGDYPDYTLVPIPRRFQEYGTDLRAMVVFNSLMAPLLNQGEIAIFQATGWNGDGVYVYRLKGDLYISYIRSVADNYVLTKEFKPAETIPYDAETFEPIGRVRAVVREID
jgi:phage repressor protein C with HTH and peptisase S24 domain